MAKECHKILAMTSRFLPEFGHGRHKLARIVSLERRGGAKQSKRCAPGKGRPVIQIDARAPISPLLRCDDFDRRPPLLLSNWRKRARQFRHLSRKMKRAIPPDRPSRPPKCGPKPGTPRFVPRPPRPRQPASRPHGSTLPAASPLAIVKSAIHRVLPRNLPLSRIDPPKHPLLGAMERPRNEPGRPEPPECGTTGGQRRRRSAAPYLWGERKPDGV